MKTIILSPEQCRWARRVLSLSQRQLSQKSSKSLSYIKQFETGRFNAGEVFQRGLLSFFEGRGVDFSDFEESQPGQTNSSKPGQPGAPATRRPCFYAAPGIDESELDAMLETIEASIERLEPLLSKKVSRGLLGVARESEQTTQEVFGELALLGLTYGAITGRFSVEPRHVADPETQTEVVANFLARARGDETEDTASDGRQVSAP